VSEATPLASTPSTSPLPAWARAADVAAVACLIVAAAVFIGGRILIVMGPVRISIGSVDRLLVAAIVLLALRHVRHRRPPLPRRLWTAWAGLWSDPALRALSVQYWAIRLSILLAGYIATASFGLADPPFRVSDNELANLPARWDAGWYLTIASDGYRYQEADTQQNIAFMPAFPVAMRVAGGLLGVDQSRMRSLGSGPDRALLVWAGVLLSLLLAWHASVMLFRLARRWMDVERAAAAALLIQAYPFAVFYGAPYTEALFLAGCTAALLGFLDRSWGTALTWGFLVGIARPNGFLLNVPLGLLLLAHGWRAWSAPGDAPAARWKTLAFPAAAAAAPVLGMLAFSALIWEITGEPFRWAQLHGAWGREYQSPITQATDVYNLLTMFGLYNYSVQAPIDVMNLAAALFGLAAVYPIWRRFGMPLAAFQLAMVVPPLLVGGVHLSMGRVTSTAFPAFLWLAAALPEGGRNGLVLAWVACQGLAATLFFTWRPLF
jgi:hypothetical protein